MWSRSLKWAAILPKSWGLCVLLQLLSVCQWSAKGRNGFKDSPVSDGADALLKCGEHLPWQIRPAHMSRANEVAPEPQRPEAPFFLQQTCCPERQRGSLRRVKPRVHSRNTAQQQPFQSQSLCREGPYSLVCHQDDDDDDDDGPDFQLHYQQKG